MLQLHINSQCLYQEYYIATHDVLRLSQYADELKKRDYFDRVKLQIEEMYAESEGTKVTLVAHSMGAPTSLYFLNTDNGLVTQDWKDKYIHAYITLSGAWAGSPIVVREIVSGYNFGIPFGLFDKFFRNVSRTLESVVWLFPYPDVFNSTIVYTPTKNYSAKDYMNLFDDIKHPTGYRMYEGVEKINKGFPDPKVRTYCYWGLGTQTPLSYHYDHSFPVDVGHDPSNTTYSKGDGAVNEVASRVCLRWPNTTIVQSRAFEGISHINMVKNSTVLDAIANVVRNVTAEGKSRPKVSDEHKSDMFHTMGYHGLATYNAIRKMIRKMVQMMVRI